jgi:hypothetical protein
VSKAEFPFGDVWARIRKVTGWKRQNDLCAYLGLKTSAISSMKSKGFFPLEWAIRIALDYDTDITFMLMGSKVEQQGFTKVKPDQVIERLKSGQPMWLALPANIAKSMEMGLIIKLCDAGGIANLNTADLEAHKRIFDGDGEK